MRWRRAGFFGRRRLTRLLPPEHGSAIYCDWAYYGPVYGGEAEAGAEGDNAAAVTGGIGFGWDADGDPGGGEDGGSGGYGRDGDCNGRLVKWGGYCSNHTLREIA